MADTSGLLSYWQNEYHHEDKNTKVDDAFLTFYNTFAQLGTQTLRSALGSSQSSCSFQSTNILESFVYTYQDQMQGLLVRYEAQNFINKKTYQLETFVQQQKKYKIIRPMGAISRLKNLDVSTF